MKQYSANTCRSSLGRINYRQSCNCGTGHVLVSSASTSMQSICRRGSEMETIWQDPALAQWLSSTRRAVTTWCKSRLKACRAHERCSLLCDHDHHNHSELHRSHDSLLPRPGPRLRRKHRQYKHQLHSTRTVLPQDLVARVHTSSTTGKGG